MAYVSEKTCFHLKDSFPFSFNSLSLLLVGSNRNSRRIARLKFAMFLQSVIVAFFLNIFSRVINLILTSRLVQDRAGRISALDLFCMDLIVEKSRTDILSVPPSRLVNRELKQRRF